MNACLGVETLKERAREEGIEKGREETLTNVLTSLMETLGLSLDQAMNALQIPEEEQKKYRALI